MMVGGGVDEELGPDEPRPVDEWPPPTSNLELTNKDGSSSRLLFLTVQYVGEEAGASFNNGLDSFSELEQRVVSPLDPNMGCTACYSPVYRSTSPIIPAPGVVSPTGGYLTSSTPPPANGLTESGMIVLSETCQFGATDNYVVTAGGRMYTQDTVSGEDGKLLLLSTDPTHSTELVVAGGDACDDQRVELLLSNGTIAYGIVESTDNTGTRVIQIPREYLVTARTQGSNLQNEQGSEQNKSVEDQIGSVQDENGHLRALYNTLKEQGLIIEPGELRLEGELDQGSQLIDTTLLEQTTLPVLGQDINTTAVPASSAPPSQRRFWCEECNVLLDKDCTEHQVNRKISDKAVPSRARATLPASYLAINQLPDTDREEYGVFARKSIPKRTQFGPIEGVIFKSEEVIVVDEIPRLELTIETETGEMRILDVSNEHMSNWMRFVRMASPGKPPNLLLSQLGASLFFTTTQAIQPRQELLVWYSPAYAIRRNLPAEPPPFEWPCSTCGKKLKTCDELTTHMNTHKTISNCDLFGASQEFTFF
ncbi:PR domain zinc finger protein 10 [Homalodisca vitripennis]|nr:PR domain zinc finger protein 10 [Homalodisca vitripennis]